MRRIYTPDLIPGMITAEDVYNFNDQLIFPKGYKLTDKAITMLASYSIPFIKIEESSLASAKIPEPEKPSIKNSPSYLDTLSASPEFKKFKQDFENHLDNFQSSINDMVEKNAPIDANQMLQGSMDILKDARGGFHVFDMLHNMRQFDDQTYAHCINVSLICNVFAGWLGWSEEDTKIVTMCGLLHDIGKLKIPDSIIRKPAKLTDEEYNVVKTHSLEGYKILVNSQVHDHVRNAALMHHERYDGSGYPLGLSGNKIDMFAQVVAIADVYDAMTSARIYRPALCPFKVVSLFEVEGLQKYDPKLILTFLENVVNTYLQNNVRLNNGVVGRIVMINKASLSRPIIQTDDAYIDLMYTPELHIEALV